MTAEGVPVERVDVAAYRVPTERPESDGTLEWDSTTLVLVEVAAGGARGIGYTYADVAAAALARERLAPLLAGRNALDVEAAWLAMNTAVRNLGRAGLATMAISAVDAALWDLKAKLLRLPLARLLGCAREAVTVYASGGFTSLSVAELCEQLQRWVEQGIGRVKMKVGRRPHDDPARVRAARRAVGARAELFVDANGAYGRKQALALADAFAAEGVSWFEEPVSSDDLEGLRLLRDRAPAGVEIAAGEYGHDAIYFRRMLEAGAVDVLMPDASRCGGITGFLRAAALAEAFAIPVSAHTAPALHVHVGCALANVRHLELFHDHVRLEAMLFDGATAPIAGELRPDPERPGLGLEFRRADAEPYRVDV